MRGERLRRGPEGQGAGRRGQDCADEYRWCVGQHPFRNVPPAVSEHAPPIGASKGTLRSNVGTGEHPSIACDGADGAERVWVIARKHHCVARTLPQQYPLLGFDVRGVVGVEVGVVGAERGDNRDVDSAPHLHVAQVRGGQLGNEDHMEGRGSAGKRVIRPRV